MLVPVTINDHPESFVLDTGAAVTSAIFGPAADTLDLHPQNIGNYRFFDLSGHQIRKFAVVKSLEIGALHLKSWQFQIWDGAIGAHSQAAGLIGPDLLRHFDLELDPAAGTVNLFDQDHCPGKVVYWTDDYIDVPAKVLRSGHIIVTTTIDGKPVETLVDTGASETMLSFPAAYRLFGLDSDSPGMEPLTTEGSDSALRLKRYQYTFKTLSIAGISVTNPKIAIIPDKIVKPLDKDDFTNTHLPQDEQPKLPDLILGMNILHKLHLYIAYGEQHLYASAASAK